MTSPVSGRPLPSSFDGNEDFYNQNGFQKVLAKLKREPLIPFGCLLTVTAFVNAYRAMRKGDHHQVQRMFRYRVAAQAFTVVCIVGGGIYLGAERQAEREVWKKAEAEKADEKRQQWIRELEARDEEEKDLKARLEKRKEKKRAADAEAAKAAFRGAQATAENTGADDATPTEAGETDKAGSGWSLGGLLGGSKGSKEDKKEDASSQPTSQSESPRK